MENYIPDTNWNTQLINPTLESQITPISTQQIIQDEEDIFQCGKCKLILPTIIDFMIHKKEHHLYGETIATEMVIPEQYDNNTNTLGDNQIWLWSPQPVAGFPQNVEMPEQNIIQLENPDNRDIESNTIAENFEPPNVIEVACSNEVRFEPNTTELPSGDSNFLCSICNKGFTKHFDYLQHFRIHTGERPFQCPVCGRTFAQKSNKKKHMSTHKIWPNDLSKTLPPEADGDMIYKCPFCDQSFSSYPRLKGHLSSHKDRKVFKCIQAHCDCMFYDEKSLLNHVTESHPAPSYRCHICSMHFNSLEDFAEHQQTHAEASDTKARNRCKKAKEKYRCLICRALFTSPEGLSNHSATATHRHECHICKKNYTSSRNLRRHLIVHDNSMTYTCDVCDKSFQSATSWKTHKLTHNPIKMYYCPQCHASFSQKDKLRRHVLIHQPTKKYKCPFNIYFGCTKEFHRQDKLKCHLLTHTKIPGQRRRGRKVKNKSEKRSESNKVDDANEKDKTVKTVELLVVPLNETWSDEPIQITCPGAEAPQKDYL